MILGLLMNYMNYEGKSLVFSFLFMTIYTDQKLSRNSRKTHKWLRASRNLCTFASETYIYFLYPPENQKLMKKLYWLRASRNCWYFGVWNQTRNQKLARKTQKWLRASRNVRTFASDFFFYHRPENQKIKKKLYILIASEPKFLVFLGLKHDSPQYFVDKSHGLSVQ